MESHLDEAGAAQVRAITQEVQPDTVLTFGPDGMTGHEGHKDVSRWATEAFEAVGKPGARLFYATQKPAFVEDMVPKLEPFHIFKPGTPPVTPVEELAIDFTCEGDLLALKASSLEAHESQIEGLLEVFGEDGLRRFIRDESYREAARKEA
jgi:LmbE family N-acetylglucosaminyl deacetylase